MNDLRSICKQHYFLLNQSRGARGHQSGASNRLPRRPRCTLNKPVNGTCFAWEVPPHPPSLLCLRVTPSTCLFSRPSISAPLPSRTAAGAPPPPPARGLLSRHSTRRREADRPTRRRLQGNFSHPIGGRFRPARPPFAAVAPGRSTPRGRGTCRHSLPYLRPFATFYRTLLSLPSGCP